MDRLPGSHGSARRGPGVAQWAAGDASSPGIVRQGDKVTIPPLNGRDHYLLAVR